MSAAGRPPSISMIGSRGIPSGYSGIERGLEEVCPRLARLGYRVTVYAHSDLDYREEVFKGVRIRKVPTLRSKHLATLSSVTASVWWEALGWADVVHFHALGPATFAPIPRLASRPTVVTVHGLDWRRAKWGWAARQFLRLGECSSAKAADATIVVSPVLQRYYSEKFGKDAHYIPNGVSPVEARPPDLIAREYGLAHRSYILFASRLVPEKGCHYLIRAFKQLETDRRLVIAGSSAHSDAYVKKLTDLAEGRNDVLFLGHQSGPALSELYSNAALYVLPSEIEGLSMSLLEAMASGLCVLVSDIPENLAVIRGGLGFSFRNGDVQDLASKLDRLLGQPDAALATGERARESVLAEYDWDRITDRISSVYRSVLSSP